MLKEGGKDKLDEIAVLGKTEELMAKEYAESVEKLQIALKRERQVKMMKSVNEKEKVATVSWGC